MKTKTEVLKTWAANNPGVALAAGLWSVGLVWGLAVNPVGTLATVALLAVVVAVAAIAALAMQ